VAIRIFLSRGMGLEEGWKCHSAALS